MAEKTKEAETKTKEQEMITIRVPRKGKEDSVLVGLNFKNYILKRGELVTIPKDVWAIVQESKHAEEFADAYAMAKEDAYYEKAAKPARLH